MRQELWDAKALECRTILKGVDARYPGMGALVVYGFPKSGSFYFLLIISAALACTADLTGQCAVNTVGLARNPKQIG
jgi:hypothetical protein